MNKPLHLKDLQAKNLRNARKCERLAKKLAKISKDIKRERHLHD